MTDRHSFITSMLAPGERPSTHLVRGPGDELTLGDQLDVVPEALDTALSVADRLLEGAPA